MKGFLSSLKSRILVCDGAMGTMLVSKGLPPGGCPEEWNITHPKVVIGIHRAYIAAGCDIIETNTFGANAIKLSHYGLEKEVCRLNEAAVKLARQAAGDKVFVASSVGPIGKILEPYGELKKEEAYDVFSEMVISQTDAGVDAIIIETMSDLEEARLALKAAKKFGVPVICTLTFDRGGRTMMGVKPDDAARVIEDEGADAVGTNCGIGPEDMIGVVEIMKKATRLPLIAQPNAGIPRLEGLKTVYDALPEVIGEYTARFIEIGVSIVGGCCGTTPAHIKRIANIVRICQR